MKEGSGNAKMIEDLEAEIAQDEEDVEQSSDSQSEDDEDSDTESTTVVGESSDSSISEIVLSDDDEIADNLFRLDDNAINEITSKGSENYLKSLFSLLKCEINFSSWKDLQSSFRLAKQEHESYLIREYIDLNYATNFQYLQLIIKRNAPVVVK